MKTIKIQSEYATMFKAYETTAVTSKGIIRTRCIQLNEENANKWAQIDNKKVPFYDENFKCTIYAVKVSEITIFTK